MAAMAISDSHLGTRAKVDPMQDVFLQGWRGDEDEDVDIESSEGNSQEAPNAQRRFLEFTATSIGGLEPIHGKGSLIIPDNRAAYSPGIPSAESLDADGACVYGLDRQEELKRYLNTSTELDDDLYHSLTKQNSAVGTEASSGPVLKQVVEEFDNFTNVSQRNSSEEETASSPVENSSLVILDGKYIELKDKATTEGKRLGAREFRTAFFAKLSGSKKLKNGSSLEGNLEHIKAVSIPSEKGNIQGNMCEGLSTQSLSTGSPKPLGKKHLVGWKETLSLDDGDDFGILQTNKFNSAENHSVDDVTAGGKDCGEERIFAVFRRKRRHPTETVQLIGNNTEQVLGSQYLKQGKAAGASVLSTAKTTSAANTSLMSGKASEVEKGEEESSGLSKRARKDDNIHTDANPCLASDRSSVSNLEKGKVEGIKCNEESAERRWEENGNLSPFKILEVEGSRDFQSCGGEYNHTSALALSKGPHNCLFAPNTKEEHFRDAQMKDSESGEKRNTGKRKLEKRLEVSAGMGIKSTAQKFLQKDKLKKHANMSWQLNRLSAWGKFKMLHRNKKRIAEKRKRVSVTKENETDDKYDNHVGPDAGSGAEGNIDDSGENDQGTGSMQIGHDMDESDYVERDSDAVKMFKSVSAVSRERGNEESNFTIPGKEVKQAGFLKSTYNDGGRGPCPLEEEAEISVTLTRQPNVEHEMDLSYGGRTDFDDDINNLEDCSFTDYHNSICEKCRLEGDLICCDGNGCKITYHISCLDPPLTEVPPDDWYCPDCTYKMSSEAHPLSNSVESIWDVQEARPSEGMATIENRGLYIGQNCEDACQHATTHELLQDKGKDAAVVNARGWNSPGKVRECLQLDEGATAVQLDCTSRVLKGPENSTTDKMYFVKYKGAAHVYNQWIPECQLMKDAPKLLANFKKRFEQGKALKWNSEWTEPCRIIGKKLTIPPKAAGCGGGSGSGSKHCLEWCVKWKGLAYEHCTWESGDTSALTTMHARELVKDYEERCEQARLRAQPGREENAINLRAGDFSKLDVQPHWIQGGEIHPQQLDALNALRKFWQGYINGIVVDAVSKERVTTTISFLLSLFKEFEVVKPVLVVVPQARVASWEMQFFQWASSLNIVTYSGIKEAREVIQTYELYTVDKFFMPQIVLTSFDVVTMEFEWFKGQQWEALVVDESQRLKSTKTSRSLYQLNCNYRLLLFSEPLKNNTDDYVQFLSLLQVATEFLECDSVQHRHLKEESSVLADFKTKIYKHIVYENKLDILGTTHLKEHWVPVEMTAVQVKEYCNLLIDKYDVLVSRNRSVDTASLLQELLLKLRECCNHPFLVNPKLQESRIDLTQKGLLEFGIKVSGKLQLLDLMLSNAKSEGHRVVILTQMHLRSEKTTQMEILDDYMRQQFGVNSYERVDGGPAMHKKQAAVQRFNRKDSGCFVFLLDKRACGPAIKLPSVNCIIIFDSDWNPQNDIQNLQKVRFNHEGEDIKLYRFYCPCSVEERALICARRNSALDNHYKNYTLVVCQRLLRWGAQENFKLYDQLSGNDINANRSGRVSYNEENLKLLLGKTSILDTDGNTLQNAYWKTALELREAGSYNKGVPLFAELDTKLIEEEQVSSSEFWSKTLKDRHLEPHDGQGRGLRARKNVQYHEDMLVQYCGETATMSTHRKDVPDNEDEARRKRKRGPDILDLVPTSTGAKNCSIKSSECMEKNAQNAQGCRAADVDGLPNRIGADRTTREEFDELGTKEVSLGNEVAHEVRTNVRTEQQHLYHIMKPHLSKLCKTLQLQEDVVKRAKQLLQFLVRRFKLPKDSKSLLHAVELSLCWLAAEERHYCIDHCATLSLAESCFGLQLKHVNSVHAKLEKQFKENFSAGQSTPPYQQSPQGSIGQGHQNHKNLVSTLNKKINEEGNQAIPVRQESETTQQEHDTAEQQVLHVAYPSAIADQGATEQAAQFLHSQDIREVQSVQQNCASGTSLHSESPLMQSNSMTEVLGVTAICSTSVSGRDQSQDYPQATSIVSASTSEPSDVMQAQEIPAIVNQQNSSLAIVNAESNINVNVTSQEMVSQGPECSTAVFFENAVNSERLDSWDHPITLRPADHLAQQPSSSFGSVQQCNHVSELVPQQQQQYQLQLPRLRHQAHVQSGVVSLEPEQIQQVPSLISNRDASNQQAQLQQQQQALRFEQFRRSSLSTPSLVHSPHWQQQHSNLQSSTGNIRSSGVNSAFELGGSLSSGAPLVPGAASRGSTYSISGSGDSSITRATQNTASVRLPQHRQHDPLSQEFLRLRKEQEKMKSTHEAEKERLKVQYVKEQEALKKRFDTLFQEEEQTYSRRAATLEANLKRVEMNRRLAEALRLKAEHDDVIPINLGFSVGVDARSMDSRPLVSLSQTYVRPQQLLTSSTRLPSSLASHVTSPTTSGDVSRSSSLSAVMTVAGIGNPTIFSQSGSSATGSVYGHLQPIGLRLQSAPSGITATAGLGQYRPPFQASNLNLHLAEGNDCILPRSTSQLVVPCTKTPNRISPCTNSPVSNLPFVWQQHQVRAANMAGFSNLCSSRDSVCASDQHQFAAGRTHMHSVTTYSTTVTHSNAPAVTTSADISGYIPVSMRPLEETQSVAKNFPEVSAACASTSVGLVDECNLPNTIADAPRELQSVSQELQVSNNREPVSLCLTGQRNVGEVLASGTFPEELEQVGPVSHEVAVVQGSTENTVRSNARVIYLSDDD